MPNIQVYRNNLKNGRLFAEKTSTFFKFSKAIELLSYL